MKYIKKTGESFILNKYLQIRLCKYCEKKLNRKRAGSKLQKSMSSSLQKLAVKSAVAWLRRRTTLQRRECPVKHRRAQQPEKDNREMSLFRNCSWRPHITVSGRYEPSPSLFCGNNVSTLSKIVVETVSFSSKCSKRVVITTKYDLFSQPLSSFSYFTHPEGPVVQSYSSNCLKWKGKNAAKCESRFSR